MRRSERHVAELIQRKLRWRGIHVHNALVRLIVRYVLDHFCDDLPSRAARRCVSYARRRGSFDRYLRMMRMLQHRYGLYDGPRGRNVEDDTRELLEKRHEEMARYPHRDRS
jgi:hypothetical protein